MSKDFRNNPNQLRDSYLSFMKEQGSVIVPSAGLLPDNDPTTLFTGSGMQPMIPYLNALVQEGNPVMHGEMAALRQAGRLINRHHTTMYTTLVPCFMCAGAIAQFGIPRVVIADTVNSTNHETIEFLQARGIEVKVLDENSRAAQNCIELTAKFKAEKPELWLEDWGGGANSELLK